MMLAHRKNRQRKRNKKLSNWHFNKQGGKTMEGLRVLDPHEFHGYRGKNSKVTWTEVC